MMGTWLEIGLSNALVATVLAAVAWVVSRHWRQPHLVYFLWLLVLAKLVTPPVWSIPWSSVPTAWIESSVADAPPSQAVRIHGNARDVDKQVADAVETHPTATTVSAQSAPAVPHSQPVALAPTPAAGHVSARAPRWTWTQIIGVTWLAGSVSWLMLALARMARFARLVRRAEEAPATIQREVRALSQRFALRRPPDVRLVRRQTPPVAWAMTGRATLLLPFDLLEALSDDERTTLLAHELSHLRRRFCLAHWLELLALALFWWHPVAWWARRHLEAAEEQLCDARVVALLPALAQDYASALLRTVEFLCDAQPIIPLGARGFSQRQLLRRRMEMILAGTNTRRVRRPLWIVLVAAAATVLPMSMHSASAQKAETLKRVKAATRGMTVEQRLERLENLVQELVDELREDRKVTTAQAPAVVVGTVPANGDENVDPNLKEIKVTFSKKMKDKNWSWVTLVKEEFPETTGAPSYDKEQRTCTLPVKLDPGKKYTLGINSSRFANFKEMSGQSAVPYVLEFTTKP